MLRAIAVCSSLLLLVTAFPVGADEMDDSDTGVARKRRQRPTAAQASDWKRHHVSVLASSISDEDFDTTEFNGGIEYEFQFHRNVGIGAQIEANTGDIRSMVALVPLFIHPWRGLRLTLGGGAVLDEDQNSDGLLRLGLGYRFNLTESLTFGPEYNADLVGGTEPDHLFGVRLGFQF